MAAKHSLGGKLLVVATAALALAGAADALSGSVSSPEAGTWFASRTLTVSGGAFDPALDVLVLNTTRGFANATADGATIANGTEVHLDPTGLTNWRFFETFDYPLGTQAANLSDHFHHSVLSGRSKNWSVTDALTSVMPDSPALGASEPLNSFSNELYWHATTPLPIVGVNVSFRFAVDDGARLLFHSSVTGIRNNFTRHMDSFLTAGDSSSVSVDLGRRFEGQTTVYLRFTFYRGSNGTEWGAVDDLEVDLSFAPQAGPQEVTFSEPFYPGTVNPSAHGRWWTVGGGWTSSNALIHFSSDETWAEARFVTTAPLAGANLSFGLICQNFGPSERYIWTEAGPSRAGPWTRLAETNSTSAVTTYASNVSALAGNQSLFFRVTAQNRCSLQDFEIALKVEGDPPEMPRGALVGERLDLGVPVDWRGSSFDSTLPAGATAEFWVRWSDDGVSWSPWARAADDPVAPFETSRYVQPMVTLSASGWGAVPVLSNLTLHFSGIRDVSLSLDAGGTWERMLLTYAPNASSVQWSGSVILEQGMNDLQVRALDTTGATALWNTTAGWDTLAPLPPDVSGDPGQFVGATELSWSWDVPYDEGLGVAEYAVRLGSIAGGGDIIPLLQVGNVTEFSYPGAADGTSYFFSVRAKDNAGNWGTWGNASYGTTVDLTPPGTGAAAAPAPFVNEPRIAWVWEPFLDNGSGVAAYEVRVGSEPDRSDVVSGVEVSGPSYLMEDAAHGRRYHLSLRARDQAGNWGAWGPSSEPVVVDLVAPTAPGVPVGPSGFLNTSEATWSWSPAQDHLAGVAAYEVQAGTAAGAADLLGRVTAQPSLYIPNLPDGERVFVRVRALDAAGNLGPWAEAPEPLAVDRTLPTAPGSLEGPTGWINQTAATWQWSPSTDAGSGVAFYEVRVGSFLGGGDLVFDHRVSGLSYMVPALREEAEIFVAVRAVDEAGNRGAFAVARAVQVDMTPPSVPGAVTSTPSPTSTPGVEWTWAPSVDFGSGVAVYLVRVGTNAAAGDIHDWTPVDGTTFAIEDAESGQAYHFSVRAVDAVGWGSRDRAADAPVHVDRDPPEAPELWASATATRERQAEVFWGVVSDPGGSGLDHYDLEFGPLGGTPESVRFSPYQFVFQLTGLDGDRVVARVRASDRAGNTGAWSEPVEVLFDRSAPSPPSNLVSQVDGRTVTLSWDASSDGGVGEVEYSVSVGTSAGGSDVVTLVLTNATALEFTGEPGVSYYFTVGAVDALGNAQPSAVSGGPVEVPSVAPVELVAAAAAIGLGTLGLLIGARRRATSRAWPGSNPVEEE
jgi:hypothetical protein